MAKTSKFSVTAAEFEAGFTKTAESLGPIPADMRPAPKPKAPSLKKMERWLMDGVAEATDGCRVEPDGTCPHGKRSWLLVLRFI